MSESAEVLIKMNCATDSNSDASPLASLHTSHHRRRQSLKCWPPESSHRFANIYQPSPKHLGHISEMKFSIYKCFTLIKLQGLKIQNKNKQMKYLASQLKLSPAPLSWDWGDSLIPHVRPWCPHSGHRTCLVLWFFLVTSQVSSHISILSLDLASHTQKMQNSLSVTEFS